MFESFCYLYVIYKKSLYYCKKIGLNPFGNAGRTTKNVQVQQLSNLIDASEKVSVSGLAGSSYAFLVAAIFEKIKKTKTISHLPLIKQSRLSVMPIDYKSWKIIYKMGKIKPN